MWKTQKIIIGVDESGRGPLAGPVVAAAVYVSQCFDIRCQNIKICDSKQMTARQRERAYQFLKDQPGVEWGIGRVGERVIDKINILKASKLAMERAIRKLKRKPDFLVLDGKMKLDLPILQKSIVKADEKVFSCAAASILAKVARDRIMEKYHLKYSRYYLNSHKGYPTKMHLRALKRYGPCKIHRKSFGPVRACKIRRFVVT